MKSTNKKKKKAQLIGMWEKDDLLEIDKYSPGEHVVGDGKVVGRQQAVVVGILKDDKDPERQVYRLMVGEYITTATGRGLFDMHVRRVTSKPEKAKKPKGTPVCPHCGRIAVSGEHHRCPREKVKPACQYCASPGKMVCSASTTKEPEGWWMRCTREKGHVGPHVACGSDQHELHTWGDVVEAPKPVEKPPERRHLKLEAVIVEAMGVAVCRVVEQTHRGHGHFTDVGSMSFEHAGLQVLSLTAPFFHDSRHSCGGSSKDELHVRGDAPEKDYRTFDIPLDRLDAVRKAVRWYNETNGGERRGEYIPPMNGSKIEIE